MTEPVADATPDDEVSTAMDTSPEAETSSDESDEAILDPRAKALLDKAKREAKNLRARLRIAEADKETDRAQLAEYRRQEVERAAAEVLVDGEDLWRYTDEATQADFNDEFGKITIDRVRQAAQAIADARPHLGKPQRPPTAQPLEGLRAGASPPPKPKSTDWASALRG